MSRANSRTFEDVKVGVRCKIAALWIAMLFLFAYGDIFGFFSPGQLQEVMAGEILPLKNANVQKIILVLSC